MPTHRHTVAAHPTGGVRKFRSMSTLNFSAKKVAEALYTSLNEMVRYQGIANLLAIITMPNEPSVAFHEHFGYIKCGEFSKVGYKLNQWQNVGWFELFLQDENEAPKDRITPLKRNNRSTHI